VLPHADPGPRLGVHLPLERGLRKAAERAGEIGAGAIQVFADNPTAWKRRASPPAHQPAFRARLDQLDIRPVAIHASYLVNLAGPDPTFRAGSLDVLASELRAAVGYGASIVNVHTGSHRETSIDAGIALVAEGVARVLAETEDEADGTALVLENAAGGGSSLGVTIEELARIADASGSRGVAEARLGFCLDTAHAWGAGFRLDDPEAIDQLIERFDRLVGLGRLKMIHLNDSRSDHGSRQDRHEHIGAGQIGERGLRHVLGHPRLRGVPFILETPGMDEGYDLINLQRARALLAGEPLQALPPEAFELSSGRNRTAAPEDGGELEADEVLEADGVLEAEVLAAGAAD
jgi:deoxyribonuclease-4